MYIILYQGIRPYSLCVCLVFTVQRFLFSATLADDMIILLTYRICVCSSTYERVTANSENLWRFERYSVIMNYKYRIPSPVNLIWFPKRLWQRFRKPKSNQHNGDTNEQGMSYTLANL